MPSPSQPASTSGSHGNSLDVVIRKGWGPVWMTDEPWDILIWKELDSSHHFCALHFSLPPAQSETHLSLAPSPLQTASPGCLMLAVQNPGAGSAMVALRKACPCLFSHLIFHSSNKHLFIAFCVPGTMSGAAHSWMNQNNYTSGEEGAYRLAGMAGSNQSLTSGRAAVD